METTMPSQAGIRRLKPEIELPAGTNCVYLRQVCYADRDDWLIIKPGQPERLVQGIKPGDDVYRTVMLKLCNELKYTVFKRHEYVRHWYPGAQMAHTWEFVRYKWRSKR